jgi:hypothetical protein
LVGARHNESLLLGQCEDGREGRCDKKRERNPAQPFNPSFSRQNSHLPGTDQIQMKDMSDFRACKSLILR